MAEKSAEKTNIQRLCLKFCLMSRHYLAHIHSLESTHSASLCRGVAPKRVDYPYTLIKGHL